jgi:uncharacterized membrane protein YphA (DoxX/SURF4 family)
MHQKLTAITWLCRLFIAALFIYAGYLKIIDPLTLAKQISAYKILPDHLINYAAITLPWVEVYAGLAMLLPFRHLRTAGAVLCLLLLLTFIGAQVSVLERGMKIECGCFGKGEQVSWMGVAKRTGYAVCALIALVGPYSQRQDQE